MNYSRELRNDKEMKIPDHRLSVKTKRNEIPMHVRRPQFQRYNPCSRHFRKII